MVFLSKRGHLVRRWEVRGNPCLTRDHHNVAATPVAVKVQRHLRVALDVCKLRLARLAVDKHGLSTPEEPDRARLRGARRPGPSSARPGARRAAAARPAGRNQSWYRAASSLARVRLARCPSAGW